MDYIDRTDIKLLKKLWDSYAVVESTGPGFSEYPEDYDQSVAFEDIEFFEHTCAIGLGIRMRIKRQEWTKSHCIGLVKERVQLFYNNIFILDVNNSVSCDNLFEFEGPKDNLGISYITYKDENIVIGAGMKKHHLYEYNEQMPNDECAFYNAEFIYSIEVSDNLLETSLEKSVAPLPLTEEKIQNIVKQKISSEQQMHLNTNMKNIAKKCSFEILINKR